MMALSMCPIPSLVESVRPDGLAMFQKRFDGSMSERKVHLEDISHVVASHRTGVIELLVLAHRPHQVFRFSALASSIPAAPVEARDYLPCLTKVVVLA